MKAAVVSDAAATPKLTDICCIVLAIVLAMLAFFFGNVGVGQRVHARELERRKKTEGHGL